MTTEKIEKLRTIVLELSQLTEEDWKELYDFLGSINVTVQENSTSNITKEDISFEQKIDKLLIEMQIAPNLKCCNYLKSAVDLVMQKPEFLHQMKALLYPTIAKKYNTTEWAVEAGIRRLSEKVYLNKDKELINSIFGELSKPPSNKNLIIELVIYLK